MTQSSARQNRVSLNVPPSLLLDELERHLQEHWVERIPNRRYSSIAPVIDPQLHAGPFAGELLEETQPMPMAHTAPATIVQAPQSKRHRFLTLLDLYAALLVVVAVVLCAGVRALGRWRRRAAAAPARSVVDLPGGGGVRLSRVEPPVGPL